jgi:hypothetical protein
LGFSHSLPYTVISLTLYKNGNKEKDINIEDIFEREKVRNEKKTRKEREKRKMRRGAKGKKVKNRKKKGRKEGEMELFFSQRCHLQEQKGGVDFNVER